MEGKRRIHCDEWRAAGLYSTDGVRRATMWTCTDAPAGPDSMVGAPARHDLVKNNAETPRKDFTCRHSNSDVPSQRKTCACLQERVGYPFLSLLVIKQTVTATQQLQQPGIGEAVVFPVRCYMNRPTDVGVEHRVTPSTCSN